MMRAIGWAWLAAVMLGMLGTTVPAEAQSPYSRHWGSGPGAHEWGRFYHYPYVYYPQNFYGPEYYRSSNSLYYRYPAEMRIPVYNRQWFNYYPEERLYHSGHHFILDTF